jgi:hypothetical protein
MAIFAGGLYMFAFQFEGGDVVVKFIIPVMTGKAVCPQGLGVSIGEDTVHFAVAVLAGVRYECGYILSMTIATGKRFIPRLALVMFQ